MESFPHASAACDSKNCNLMYEIKGHAILLLYPSGDEKVVLEIVHLTTVHDCQQVACCPCRFRVVAMSSCVVSIYKFFIY